MPRTSTIAQDFLNQLQAAGRWSFTSGEALDAHGGSLPAARAVLRRLRLAGAIATPHRGFHVILPPQFRNLGCLPPEYFIEDLMDYLGADYQIGLASAAAYYGATHQALQRMQVMVDHPRRPIRCGRVRIEFIMQKHLDAIPAYEFESPAGTVIVSSAEATAYALVGYAERAGGLNAVATMLFEMGDELRGARLEELLPVFPLAWSQRLGFLLDFLGYEKLARSLYVPLQRLDDWRVVPLSPHLTMDGGMLDEDWCIVVNDDLEPDL